MRADPGRLTESERCVLALLAEGHTAKSIAAATGLSVYAVNERLREARRKTGVGSSRELARLVKAQENRDEEIGVATPGADASTRPLPEAARGDRRFGAREFTVMTIAAAVALFTLFTFQQQPSPAVTNPYSALARPATDTAALYRQVRAEQIDQAWAVEAERRLESLYAPVAGVGPVEIICARTLCEVAGEITPGNEARAAEMIQSRGFHDSVRRIGFAETPIFTIGAEEGATRFFTYWRRARR